MVQFYWGAESLQFVWLKEVPNLFYFTKDNHVFRFSFENIS